MSPARPRRPSRLVALVVALVVLAAPACSEPAGPSQDQYVAMADNVCEATDEKLTGLYEAYEVAKYEAAASGESSTYVDRPDRWVRAKIVPEYKRMLGGLRGIRPPDGDRSYLSDIYADLGRRIEVLHNHPGDGRAVIEGDAQLRQRFASYGMEKCPGPKPAGTAEPVASTEPAG